MAATGRRVLRLLLTLVLPFAILPATAQEFPAPPAGWDSPLGRDHRLAGVIWSAQERRPVSPEEVITALAKSSIVLLGETHDNADHHRLRAWVIGALASRRPRADGEGSGGPAIVFEHIRADQQQTVDTYISTHAERTAAGLLQALDWERSGWPAGRLFTPLFEEALRLRLPILGGNTPREAIRSVGRQGLAALSAEERVRLGLDVQLESPLRQALVGEIEASHCGLLPEAAFAPMAIAQQYRDAHLANVLLTAQRQYGSAVLIAGTGHVRSDRAVPWHLRRRAPEVGSIVVAFAEVENGEGDAESYVPRDPAGGAAADYIWFTPKAERPDPCEGMRQRFQDTSGKSSGRPAGSERGSGE